MTYEWLTELPSFLDKWGVSWIGFQNWETHAAQPPAVRDYTPAFLVNHHTAATNWYPIERLKNKCNMYIDPSGVVYVMSLGYQYDSGYGDPNVLMRARNDQEPEPPQDATPADRINMNPWGVDVEVGHWGGGEPIPDRQREALILVNCAVLDMQGWDPMTRLLGHKELTRRKVDPRWSYQGWPDSMGRIREDTNNLFVERTTMPKTQWYQMIDALFEGRPDVFQGDPGYWKFDVPEDSDEWSDFWDAFVRSYWV